MISKPGSDKHRNPVWRNTASCLGISSFATTVVVAGEENGHTDRSFGAQTWQHLETGFAAT